MGERTTKADLGRLAFLINNAVGEVHKENGYFVQWAYGRPRLMRAGGSVDVSPRLPSGQLADWMRAFHAGIIVGREL